MSNSLVSKSDWDFIREISSRFPDRKIQETFHKFLSMSPEERPNAAVEMQENVPRRGFTRIGIPEEEGQSLADHVRTLQEMVCLTPAFLKAARCYDVVTIHDIAEALTSDFTPVDNISKPEKNRLERLAMHIIFESDPEKIMFWEEYCANETDLAHWAKDMDKLELVLEVEQQEQRHPAQSALLDGFRQSASRGLQTEHGKVVYAFLEASREANDNAPKAERIEQVRSYLSHGLH